MTTVEQTLLDFAAGADRRLLRLALASADYRSLLDIAAIDGLCRRGAAGSARLGAALGVHRPESAQARSELERRLIELCEAHGPPAPMLNVYRHGFLLDAVWDEARLVAELDGYPGHRSRAQLKSDHQRDLELRSRGHRVLRYTWHQLTRAPATVARDIRRHPIP